MKKILVCLFTALMLLSLCGVSALELDTAEASESVENADAALAATTFPVAHKPGINLATGTSEPLTFEDGAALGGLFKGLSSTTYVKDQAVVDITGLGTTGNTSTKALRVGLYKNTGADGTATATTGWHGIHLSMKLEMNRKYYISADEYADLYTINPNAAIIGDTFALWSKGIQDTKQALGNNSKAGKWYKQVWDKDLNHMPSNHFTGAFSFAFQLTSDTAYNAYVDNLMVVPYYKVTYAGDTTTSEWYLFDKDGKIATTYTPKTDNYPANKTENGKSMKCIGWSDYKDSGFASDVVYLYNSDITLYPVWQEAELLSTPSTVLEDEGSVTVTANEDVTWSYDEENTSASVTSSDARSITVATTKENTSGEFAVKATTADGEEVELVINVIKTTPVLAPGINMLTGTEKAIDFENFDKVPAIFSLTNNTYISDISIGSVDMASTGNASKYALKLTRNHEFAKQAWQSVFRIASVLENGRPYSVSAKMFTDLYINGATVTSGHNARIYWGWTGGSAGSAWVNFDNNFTNPVKTGAWYNYNNKKLTYNGTNANVLPIGFEITVNDTRTEGYFFDDILIMPHYKVTYKNPDGTDAYSEYVLYDANGKILTEYTIDATKVPTATGFALSQSDADAGNFVTKVTLENKDVVIYSTDKAGITFTDGETEKYIDVNGSFTFPTPEEAGLNVENFLKWTNGDEHFDAGYVLEDASAYINTTFTAFCQDASKPAMGFAFEGDGAGYTDINGSNKVDEQIATTSRLYMEADGRDYYHINMRNSAGTYVEDAKFWFNASRFAPGKASINGAEYSIFSYSAKVLNAVTVKDSVVTPLDSVKVKIFYHGSAWSGLSEARKIGNKDYNNMPVGKYFNITCDMSELDAAWNTASIANIIVEPARAKYSFDVYFDYIRVYRKGITTVTYDTNAPEGAEVLTNVAPETGRGVGKDYKLTGLRPEVEGYTFLGWALTADGTETVEAIDLTGDTTVYAVWKQEGLLSAATVTDKCEIRGNTTVNGIRFKSEIKNSQKENFKEFGFITTREALLPKDGEAVDCNALTFDMKDFAGKALYAYGVSYNKDKKTDIIFGDNDDGSLVYTAVLTGIPMAYKKENMVVRSYAKYEINGNDITVYGNTNTASLYDTALSIKEAGDAAYEANKEYIDSVLAE